METILPAEMVENILCRENLSISDVINFSLTNQYYYNVVRNLNAMWKKKYIQTWPQFSTLFEKKSCKFCWYQEIRYVYKLKRRTRIILTKMSSSCYKRQQLLGSHFAKWLKLCDENPRTYDYLIHDLLNIAKTNVAINTMETVPISTPGNQTLQYYALKVFRFLMHYQLTEEWLTYSELPPSQQTMEKGIVLVNRWCESVVYGSSKNIPKALDNLAEKIKNQLKLIDSNHPIFAVPEKDLKRWRDENIEGNKYSTKYCTKVEQALEIVFGFTYQSINVLNVDVNAILGHERILLQEILDTDLIKICGARNGLLLVYESVARRLGLKYEVVYSSELKRFTLMPSDIFYNVMEDTTQRNQLRAIDDYVNVVASQLVEDDGLEIFRTVCGCCAQLYPDLDLLKLLKYLTPVIVSPRKFMLKCYVDHTEDSTAFLHNVVRKEIVDLDEIGTQIEKMARKNRCKTFEKAEHRVRPQNLKYAVGMLVRFGRSLGTICDWKMASRNKPVYNVLFRDGLYETVPQDLLRPYYGRKLNFELYIGMHFSHAFKTHFVPNAEKEKEYPADRSVRIKYHQEKMARIGNE